MDTSKLMFRPELLKNERIIVTGGGTGLGKEMAQAFAALGAEVVILGRRSAPLESTSSELNGLYGKKVTPLVCDIRSSEAITKAIDLAWDGGVVTTLVNNAAAGFISRTEDLSPGGFDAISNTVFRGTFLATLELGKRWIARGLPGNVVSILASSVFNGGPFMVPLAMSKGGLHVMTQSLALEWAPHGIRVNAIAAGTFPTDGGGSRMNPRVGEMPTNDSAFVSPMQRVGQMHELCNVAVMLVGQGAGYINGETISIDGGAHLATSRYLELAKWDDQRWAAVRASIRSKDVRDREERST
ncbi:SDR family oxidoreductase [Tardiphaga sp. 538_B7_N1_4]|uniref:SDR family oxidoreductase n=1 Tax=Tardiphaga sp. 538_B7_N1_4 TaxID=3240778 RepID=UPI001B8A1EFF|nr:SDR family oxidoreductase [Bradyrhizobium diazoefficiens]MBR0967370.1 SDR family oxidoreductase [Bradyrhizobium diazoefficiens]MBR0976691.1 SDR family oxidoreductase [Bradyrhizobium diazoefficiens]MBR1005336.1 SDR family oxidoreductase [Bradyrhizobium diazoefficiens]MBR1011809.1 SDR family oxidoreductase [Bradyrhizobium diazoefficiens]MBR1049150.1 SDR family oxidoreductase [Bradyrhizobium diazoefficiens]